MTEAIIIALIGATATVVAAWISSRRSRSQRVSETGTSEQVSVKIPEQPVQEGLPIHLPEDSTCSSVQTDSLCKVLIVRPRRHIGTSVKITVRINGNTVCQLMNGESASVACVAGRHVVEAEAAWGNGSRAQAVMMYPGKVVHVTTFISLGGTQLSVNLLA
jgi:hypothetical protein